MPRSIALLRGVNVGGKGMLPMAALRDALAAAGYPDARTYVQSGNVVLSGAASTIETDLAAILSKEFGLTVPVIVRTGPQLAKVVSGNPFLRAEADPGRLLVGFLHDKPTKAAADAIDPHRADPDELRIVGREVYFWCPNGWGNSKVSNGLEKALGTAMTARNWRTVTTLLDMARAK